jgi:hypothetical protein
VLIGIVQEVAEILPEGLGAAVTVKLEVRVLPNPKVVSGIGQLPLEASVFL